IGTLLWHSQSVREDYYEFEMRHKVSLGEIDPDDLESTYDAPTHGDKPWVDLPEVMYHVATAASAIEATGLKSRYELSMRDGVGLGGGDDQTISFTESREIAEGIEFFLHEAQAVASGNYDLLEMMKDAEAGKGADESFLTDFLTRSRGSRSSFHDAVESGWSPNDPTEEWPDPIKSWYEDKTVRSSEEAILDHNFDFYRYNFVRARQAHGGLKDPVFFSTDRAGLAALDPSEFKIIEVKSKPGAKGFQMSALGEWRVVGGDVIEIAEIHDTEPVTERTIGVTVALDVMPVSIPISAITKEGWDQIGLKSVEPEGTVVAEEEKPSLSSEETGETSELFVAVGISEEGSYSILGPQEEKEQRSRDMASMLIRRARKEGEEAL
ncbi:hypothetical protein LCGC14_2540430, partial [marine sediment metagenome]